MRADLRARARRTWLRGRETVAKRYLVHIAAYNLGLVMRALLGAGTPRAAADLQLLWLTPTIASSCCSVPRPPARPRSRSSRSRPTIGIYQRAANDRDGQRTKGTMGAGPTSGFVIVAFAGRPYWSCARTGSWT